MNDINCWLLKFKPCEYSDRLLNKLLSLNKEVDSPVDIDEITKAIYYARKYHNTQMRQSGEPYYSHPIEVAYLLAEYTALKIPKYFRTDMIVTSLLHDTIEDTELTENMIASIFGNQVASQVESLTRVKNYGKITSAEILDLLYTQKKHDILFIKLFDRLHNMQTLSAKTAEKIKKIQEETLIEFIILALYLESPEIKCDFLKLCLQPASFNILTNLYDLNLFEEIHEIAPVSKCAGFQKQTLQQQES